MVSTVVGLFPVYGTSYTSYHKLKLSAQYIASKKHNSAYKYVALE